MGKGPQQSARLKVTVIPKSSRREVNLSANGLQVRVTAAPTEGKANEMCLALVADWLGVAKSRLAILHGSHQREKVIVIDGIEQDELEGRIRARTSPR